MVLDPSTPPLVLSSVFNTALLFNTPVQSDVFDTALFNTSLIGAPAGSGLAYALIRKRAVFNTSLRLCEVTYWIRSTKEPYSIRHLRSTKEPYSIRHLAQAEWRIEYGSFVDQCIRKSASSRSANKWRIEEGSFVDSWIPRSPSSRSATASVCLPALHGVFNRALLRTKWFAYPLIRNKVTCVSTNSQQTPIEYVIQSACTEWRI